MRVYVPSTLPGLARLVARHELEPSPLRAYAVTEALRTELETDDAEELEYAALRNAADVSLELLGDEAAAARQRVVLAAEVPDSAVRPGAPGQASAVLVDRPIPYERVVSAHLDEPGAGSDDELLWYARQELPDLVDGPEEPG